MTLEKGVPYQMKPHEKEYIADFFEWAMQCGVKTIELRAYIVESGKGKMFKRIPEFKCRCHIFENGTFKTYEYKAHTIEDLRFKMGKKMHELWESESYEDGDAEDDDEDLDGL